MVKQEAAPARPRRYRRKDANGVSTRERLLLATEELVALHGVDGVSTRQISRAAATELGAIHHHFGSKDQLMLAVLDWRVAMVDEQVGKDIARMGDRMDAPDVADLARLILEPLVAVSRSKGGIRNYPSFLVAITNCQRLAGGAAVDTVWSKTLMDVFARARPDLEEMERRRRFAICSMIAINGVANGGMRSWVAPSNPEEDRALDTALLACVTASLAAPA